MIIPRSFAIQGNSYVIENGVSKDMLKAQMINVLPARKPQEERFQLTVQGHEAVLSLIPRSRLEDLGAIEPLVI
jgi:hypothetical protein